MERAIKTKEQVRFKGFGYQNTPIVKLREMERSKTTPKHKDYMKDVEISKRFLESARRKRNNEGEIY